MSHHVFIAGSTGYMGQRLISALIPGGHDVRALARPGSEHKLPGGCTIISGNPLQADSYSRQVSPADTWVHLVGVSHPSPSKAEQFNSIDLKSIEVAIPIAVAAGIKHFVYVSVAHPAPMMKAYIEVRTKCEAMIRASGLNATILRPWYVLGPGHRWPIILKPFYSLLERIPATSASAQRLGLVTLDQMIASLVHAVEDPTPGVRIIEVPQIREELT